VSTHFTACAYGVGVLISAGDIIFPFSEYPDWISNSVRYNEGQSGRGNGSLKSDVIVKESVEIALVGRYDTEEDEEEGRALVGSDSNEEEDGEGESAGCSVVGVP
jgi:hypothetical protein